MTRSPRPTPLRIVMLLTLALLTIVPRFWKLDVRPLMHDESQDCYYSYIVSTGQHYTFSPILHGPYIQLSTGVVMQFLHDSVGVARGYVAVCSLVALAFMFLLVPRQGRIWMAPLLILSPSILYYSRFFRAEMLFNAWFMLAMYGMITCLTPGRRYRPIWAGASACALMTLLTIKINAVFVYATGLSFFGLWWLLPKIWPGVDRAFRPPRRSILPAEESSHKQRADRRRPPRGKASAQALPPAQVAAMWKGDRGLATPQAATPHDAGSPPAATAQRAYRDASRFNLWIIIGWQWGAALGIVIIMWLYGITAAEGKFDPFSNLHSMWNYWFGQNSQQRIPGPLHYHLPIMATYELPMILLLIAGLAWDAAKSLARTALYGGALVAWLVFWKLWSWHPITGGPLLKILNLLHLEPNYSVLVLGVCIVPLLVWSILMLKEHCVLASWVGWWAACSLFQYSSAGEKVPWLGIYIDMPIYMTLAWIWAPRLRRMGADARIIAATVVIASSIFYATLDAPLCEAPTVAGISADPTDRLIYNHTTDTFQQFCFDMIAMWEKDSATIPLKDREVVLSGAPEWPGYWYFRHCRAVHFQTPTPNTDLMLSEPSTIDDFMRTAPPHTWRSGKIEMRSAWVPYDIPELIHEKVYVRSMLLYFWQRRTWNDLGGYDIKFLRPIRERMTDLTKPIATPVPEVLKPPGRGTPDARQTQTPEITPARASTGR